MAPTREQAEKAFQRFMQTYRAKYLKAMRCLVKDRDALLACYDFPAEHWVHLRTTNPIESTFATLRHRTDPTKGCVTQETHLSMILLLSCHPDGARFFAASTFEVRDRQLTGGPAQSEGQSDLAQGLVKGMGC